MHAGSPRGGASKTRGETARRRAPSRAVARKPAGGSSHPGHVQAQAALAAALDPIITIDFEGVIQSASDSVERVFGWRPAEIVGRNVSILMPEPHRSAHDGYLERYHTTGRTNILNRPRRFDAMRKDGSLFPIELSVARAEGPDGGEPLFVGIIRDMTAQAAEEQSREIQQVRAQRLLAEQTSALRTAHLRLRMSDRMASIGTLAAGLGHDMSNVLLPVRARLNALRAAGAAGRIQPDDLAHVEEIRNSVAYLQQLADGLHMLALDPDTGGAEASDGSPQVTDLAPWWGQIGVLISRAVPRHVRVTASIPPGMPSVRVAPHRLTQAILNLVVNAGEAVPQPSERRRVQGRVHVWAKPQPRDRLVTLGVTDNGRGMSEEVRRRAFEMFFTTKPRGLGTGLGLALVRKVMDGAGGEVEIDTRAGKGTTVSLHLPAVDVDAARRDRPVTFALALADARAADLVRQILEAGGAKGLDGPDARERADIWVAHPRAPAGSAPRGRVVLMGSPSEAEAAAWRRVDPVVIDRPDDMGSVRAGLARAMSLARS
jgi:PAS domain S-box-containing protein